MSTSPAIYHSRPINRLAGITQRVGNTLGSIDLDLSSVSNDDALSLNWHGKVYVKLSYGRAISRWTKKVIAEYQAGRVSAAIALVPGRTDTRWFRAFRDYPRCFIRGRLKFSGHQNSAPFPSVVMYLGSDIDGFSGAFADMGDVWVRWQG